VKLKDVVDGTMKAKKWDQTALGKQLGATQSMVSRMRKGDDWEQHWQIFLKLLPLCLELDLITERELLPSQRHDKKSDPSGSKARTPTSDRG
jgi:hypothetical protein